MEKDSQPIALLSIFIFTFLPTLGWAHPASDLERLLTSPFGRRLVASTSYLDFLESIDPYAWEAAGANPYRKTLDDQEVRQARLLAVVDKRPDTVSTPELVRRLERIERRALKIARPEYPGPALIDAIAEYELRGQLQPSGIYAFATGGRPSLLKQARSRLLRDPEALFRSQVEELEARYSQVEGWRGHLHDMSLAGVHSLRRSALAHFEQDLQDEARAFEDLLKTALQIGLLESDAHRGLFVDFASRIERQLLSHNINVQGRRRPGMRGYDIPFSADPVLERLAQLKAKYLGLD